MITDEQWKLIDKKYGMLLAKICHQISGDNALCSYDDNLQDLRIASMDAVDGYERQNDGANGTFDEFWGTRGFDRYIKTCLWNMKNNKGAKITKKSILTKGTVSANDNEEVLGLVGSGSNYLENNVFIEELVNGIDGVKRDIIKLVMKDHNYLKVNGRINISMVARTLGIPRHHAEKEIKEIPLLFDEYEG